MVAGQCVLTQVAGWASKCTTTPLHRLDALMADGLAAGICDVSSCDRGLEVVIVLIGVEACLPLGLLGWRSGWRPLRMTICQ